MSTNKTDAAADVLPDAIDDAVDTGAVDTVLADAALEPDSQRSLADQVPIRSRFDDDRRRIIEEAREARRKMEAGEADDDASAQDDEPAAVAEQQRQPVTQAAAPTSVNDDMEMDLLVFGQPVKKTLGEIKAEAQKSLAADRKLEEAKTLVAEVKALRESLAQRAADPGAEHHRDGDDDERAVTGRNRNGGTEHHQPADMDENDLESIVTSIQTGDTDEGREAIKKLVQIARAGNTTQLDATKVQSIVHDGLVQAETKKEIDGALKRFTETFPSLASDDEYVDVTLRRVSNELRTDLKSAGYSDEDLAKVSNPADLARLHADVRRKGAKVRTYDELLTGVGTHLSTKFGIQAKPKEAPVSNPPPAQQAKPAATTAQQREAMKRSAGQQPRAVGSRAPVAAAPRQKTHAEIVEEVRRSRTWIK